MGSTIEAGREAGFETTDDYNGEKQEGFGLMEQTSWQGRRWSTVGVSANIVDASFEALLDAIQWKLIRDVKEGGL